VSNWSHSHCPPISAGQRYSKSKLVGQAVTLPSAAAVNAKDITVKADRAETSEGIFRREEGYGYETSDKIGLGLMGKEEGRTENKNQIFISFD
jgi:hypothetical protein